MQGENNLCPGDEMKLRLSIAILVLLAATAAFAQAGPAERFTDFEGARLHYQDYGTGPEAVVLIHGWSCDHSFWRLQAPELAKKWRVIALDLPGHGLSDKPDVEYTQKYFARAVAAVLGHAGVRRTVLAGHSMGYVVAREFYAAHPDMVRGLVVVDGAFMQAPQSEEAQKKYNEMAAGMKAMFAVEDYAGAVKAFVAPMHGKATSQDVREEVLQKMTATPPHVGRSAIGHFFDLENWREMTVKVPTLAICAQNPANPPDLEQQLRQVHPGLEFVMWQDVGHFYMLERPAELNKALIEFVSAVGLEKAR